MKRSASRSRSRSREKIKHKQELQDIVHKENDFICGICLNYIAVAVTTKCGHTYCDLCLQDYLLFDKGCPRCSENLRKSPSGSCLVLDQMIEKFIQTLDEEEKKQFNQRIEESKKWRKERQLKSSDVGDSIDVRDRSYVWRQGIIKRVKLSQDQNRTKSLLIHYLGLSDDYDEDLLETNQRLAPAGFYTSRTDIPKYCDSKNPFMRHLLTLKEDNQTLYFEVDENSQSN